MVKLFKRLSYLQSHRFYLVVSCTIVCCIGIINTKKASIVPLHIKLICQSEKVIDGDSVLMHCSGVEKLLNIRIQQIDAPEMSQAAWGEKSRQALERLLTQPPITISLTGKDIYARDLAWIYNQHGDVAEQMLLQGMARVYSQYRPPEGYRAAMRQAKKAKRGIWSIKGLHQDPKRYRRLAY